MRWFSLIIILLLSALAIGCNGEFGINTNYSTLLLTEEHTGSEMHITLSVPANAGVPVVTGIPEQNVTFKGDSVYFILLPGDTAEVSFTSYGPLEPFSYREIMMGSSTREIALMPLP